jgi:hypothetical protein
MIESAAKASGLHLSRISSLALGGEGHAVPALMKNFSSEGAFLYCDQSIRREERVGFIVELPPEVTGGTSRRVWCLGKVLPDRRGYY